MGETASDRELFERAGALFDRRVHEVPADAWENPTPDTEWNVRDLVNHMVSEHLWVPPLLGGASVADLGDQFDGDVVGADPVAAWERAWAQSRTAWSGVDDEQPVHLSRGPTPAREYREEMLFDLVVHAWDLARGAGLDETGDRGAVEHALAMAERYFADSAGSSYFAKPIKIESDDPQDRLLGLSGRQP